MKTYIKIKLPFNRRQTTDAHDTQTRSVSTRSVSDRKKLSPCHTIGCIAICRGHDSGNAVVVWQVTLKYVEALIGGCAEAYSQC